MDVTITPGGLLLALGALLCHSAFVLWVGGRFLGRRPVRAVKVAERRVPLDLVPGRHRPQHAPLAAAVAAIRAPDPKPPAWIGPTVARVPHADPAAITADLHARRTRRQP